jgi:uncharacterized protein YggT (Ycf19 family)
MLLSAIMPTRTELIEGDYHPAGPILLLGRILDFLFALLYALLVVRFALELINAARDAGFVRFIHALSEPFFAPFRGIVADTVIDGHRVVWSLVVALIAYVIGHALLRALLRVVTRAY